MNPVRTLPARPDLEQLKKQAKELRVSGQFASLSEAQHAIAHEYGHDTWAALKFAVQQITLRRLIEEGDAAGVRALVTTSRRLLKAAYGDGSTPLHVAACENRPEVVAALVEAGAPLRARYGTSSHSALSWAVTCWSFAAAEKLVELGVKPDLFAAAGLGRLDLVKSFWRDGKLRRHPSATGSSRYSDTGAQLPSPPDDDRDQVSDALYIACRCERLEVARWLLDHGADPNWRGYAGATCLAWAEFSRNPELSALVRQHGGSDEILDQQFQSTPRVFGIMILAGWAFPKILLTRLTADPFLVQLRSARGRTPLHEAAANGHVACVKILLAFRADRTAKDDEGRTPKDLAETSGHRAVVDLLAAGQ